MSAFVAQTANIDSVSTATSISKAFASAVAAGASLMAVVTWGGTGTPTCSGARNGALTQKGSTLFSSADGESVATFVLDGAAAGTETITANFPSSSFNSLVIIEVDGTSGYAGTAGQEQNTPGAGANAVTSGNITPATVPGLLVGVGLNVHNGATVAAGTSIGFTDLGATGTTAIVGRVESFHYISAAAIAATFSLGGVNPTLANTCAVAALFNDGGSGTYTLTCAAGSFAMTGESASFSESSDFVLLCQSGTFNLLGAPASSSYALYAQAGSFVETGQAATLVGPQSQLLCGTGFFTMTGEAANLGPIGGRVMAIRDGYYRGLLRLAGDVFDLVVSTDYSAFNVSVVPATDLAYPVFGWMEQVPSTTPLVNQVQDLQQAGAFIPPGRHDQEDRYMTVHVLPAKVEHADRIARNMRDRDIMELYAGWAERPEETIRRGVPNSLRAITVLWNLQPICMAGVIPVSLITCSFLLWIVPTRIIDERPFAFARASKRWLPHLMQGVRVATNLIERSDVAAIKWAQWLGAELRPYDATHDQFFIKGREDAWQLACHSPAA